MEPVEIKELTIGGETYRIRIYHDPDATNPLEDWSEMGSILSLNRRHRNFDPAGVEEALTGNADAVPLSYFEHGLCRWSVAGELPAVCQCPWDSVVLAGIWVPDAETLASAKNYGGFTRRMFMRKRAHQACDAYTQWSNGEVYGYEVERVTACTACRAEQAEILDSCWGFYGLEYCRSEALAAVPPA